MKKIKILCATFLLIITIFGVIYYQLDRNINRLQQEITKEISKIRDQKLPTDLKELDEWYPSVDQGKNGAVACQKVFDSYVDYLSNFISEGITPSSVVIAVDEGNISKKELELIKVYLEKNQKTFSLLKLAIQYQQFRFTDFSVAPNDLVFGHLEPLNQISTLLYVKTFYHIEKQQYQEALDSIVVYMQLGKCLTEEPTLTSFGMFKQIQSRNFLLIEKLLSCYRCDKKQLSNIVQQMPNLYKKDFLYEALVFDRAVNMTYFSDILAGKFNQVKEMKWRQRFIWNCKKRLGYFHQDYLCYIQITEEVLAASQKSHVTRISQLSKFESRKELNQNPLSKLYLPSLRHLSYQDADCFVIYYLISAALSVERYYLEFHKIPEDLYKIMPNDLKELQNPYGSWKYQKNSNGYSISSQRRSDYFPRKIEFFVKRE